MDKLVLKNEHTNRRVPPENKYISDALESYELRTYTRVAVARGGWEVFSPKKVQRAGETTAKSFNTPGTVNNLETVNR